MEEVKKNEFFWNIPQIASALKISDKDVINYFTDGRRISFLLERRIAYEFLKGKLASSEGAGFDVIDPEGRKWEIRSITHGGIYFCPSYMVGSGRHFDEMGFIKKLEDIEGYIVSDITRFPKIPFWVIPKEKVIEWWMIGYLGTTTKINRSKALELINSMV